MSTFKVDRTKASFITEEVKQRIIELYHNNIRFLPYLNYPNKEMFWGLFKNEPINVKMAIALMFGEKMDIFAGCKVLPFEFICCRAVLELNLPNSIEEIKWINGISLPNLSIINISQDNVFFSLIDGALYNKKSKRIICYPVKRTNKDYIIPRNVKALEKYSFAKNEYIENISISEGLTKIGMHCFSDCTALKNINIPSTVKDISRGAFRNDCNLTSIVIPNAIKVIKDNLFDGCSKLNSITFGNGVEIIGFDAFRKCSSLTNVYLPDSVRYIGSYAFHMCKSLCKVSLPKDIKTVSGRAFVKCNLLTAIDYRGTMEQWKTVSTRSTPINYKNKIKVIHCIDGDIKI